MEMAAIWKNFMTKAAIIKSGVIAMSISNAVVLGVGVLSYLFYSKLMSPTQYGVYAGALALAKFGTTILDGGLKVALVKHHEIPSSEVLRALFLGSMRTSVAATLLLSISLYIIFYQKILDAESVVFLTLYALAYFLTYPFLFIPLAKLERNQCFIPIAQIETLSVAIEYALPALLWFFVAPGYWSFILAVWISRIYRSFQVFYATNDRSWLFSDTRPNWALSREIFFEGIGLQVAVLAATLRDSIHFLIIGPLFGSAWVGLYAWSLQICSVASQVFVQTATRVALPALRLKGSKILRWNTTLNQIVWLTICTAPSLLFLTDLAGAANSELFESKWTGALTLLPFLVIRMLPGIALTSLSPLIMIERGARVYAAASFLWTLAEVVVAAILIWFYGAIGLAWSYSFMVWFGVVTFMYQLKSSSKFTSLLASLIFRPSLWLAFIMLLIYRYVIAQQGFNPNLIQICFLSLIGIIVSILSEPRVWIILRPHICSREFTK